MSMGALLASAEGGKNTYILDEHEALSIGYNLGGVQSLLEVLEESSLVLDVAWVWCWASKPLSSTATLCLEGGQATSEDSLTDESHGLAEIQSVDGGPLAGTLLTCGVEDDIDGGGAVLVDVLEDITGDFDEERVQDTLVPLLENVTDFGVAQSKTALHDVVGLHTAR